MEGVGIYKWPEGRIFEGKFENDKKHGYGFYKWPDGRDFSGWWFDGKQHGLGIYTDSNNKETKYGLWQMGKRVKWFNEEEISKIKIKLLDYM